MRTSASTLMLVRRPCGNPGTFDGLKAPRSYLPLQLEYETSLRLDNGYISPKDTIRTSFSSNHLGHNNSLGSSEEPFYALHTLLDAYKPAQESRQNKKTLQVKARSRIGPWLDSIEKLKTQIPDHRYLWHAIRYNERDIGTGMECAAVGRRVNMDNGRRS